jgi:hypothetical protein
MAEKDLHDSMRMTGDEHDEWHRKHKKMSGKEHDELIKLMGITEEEHEVWHRLHGTAMDRAEKGLRQRVDPLAIGNAFLEYCVKKKWLVKEGRGRTAKYYPTAEGQDALRKFGLEL